MVYNYYKQHLTSTLKPAADNLGIAYNSVLKAVRLLSALEILQPVNEQARNRGFIYTHINNEFISET